MGTGFELSGAGFTPVQPHRRGEGQHTAAEAKYHYNLTVGILQPTRTLSSSMGRTTLAWSQKPLSGDVPKPGRVAAQSQINKHRQGLRPQHRCSESKVPLLSASTLRQSWRRMRV